MCESDVEKAFFLFSLFCYFGFENLFQNFSKGASGAMMAIKNNDGDDGNN